MEREEHYETEVAYGLDCWRRIEVEAFTGDYRFADYSYALDAALANRGREDGYRIRKVVTTTEVIEEVRP